MVNACNSLVEVEMLQFVAALPTNFQRIIISERKLK